MGGSRRKTSEFIIPQPQPVCNFLRGEGQRTGESPTPVTRVRLDPEPHFPRSQRQLVCP